MAHAQRSGSRTGSRTSSHCSAVVRRAMQWGVAAALALGMQPWAVAAAGEQTASAGSAAIDRRVILLTRELGLDVQQQERVRNVLVEQRNQVVRVWSDASVPPALRVGNTRNIEAHTADQIRAVLNDVQRNKYPSPRSDAAANLPRPSVDAWVRPTGSEGKW